MCQAFLLLSVYSRLTDGWPEDRSWLYLGISISLAMDLRLHERLPGAYTNEAYEREALNRTRTWLFCYNMDRELATRFGRPSAIPENYIASHSREWYRNSPYNGPLDLHICYYTQLLQIVTRYFGRIYSNTESITGFNSDINFESIVLSFDKEMGYFMTDMRHANASSSYGSHPSCQYQLAQMPLVVTYYRLMMYSFGLEHSYKSSGVISTMFLTSAVDAAAEVLQIANRTLPKYDFYRYSPDRHWSWPVHAASFLIKLVKPRCIELPGLTLTESQHTEILSLLDRFIHILRTSAIDDRHPPALYACSLADILSEGALDTRGMGCIENQQGLITDGSVPQIGLENFWDRML
ncbi:hypothetical protein RSOLAG1IB_10017 [Rhizoctonia solani AG-1 IB]|uniref:Xylanolytic transcriptional activator regulatory domain-containing protein n=1 Tax=Thanatephorus cucumeris (strain AG1-IB / isolate 7/3/14) TaxID=1108050 RepID=A0A0B7FUM9_THACB|nr:hypothetical protein RSOLAG1IB_10017 [Rhizoctonia solani AG-1 IB]